MARNNYRKAELAKNASKMHKKMSLLLAESPIFRNYKYYQEYPVKNVNSTYPNNKERFDWVIIGLGVVIELHGKQHYEPVTFGGMTREEAQDAFEHQQMRDDLKRRAAEEAGWIYIVFKYNENITNNALMEKIRHNKPKYQANQEIIMEELKIPSYKKEYKRPKESDTHRKKRLAKAKEARQKAYRRKKEWAKKNARYN